MIFLGVLEEINEFHDLLLGSIHASHMLEACLYLLIDTVYLDIGLSHAEYVAESAALA